MNIVDILFPSCALFLDFDGTLVDIAPQPEAVIVPSELVATLTALILLLGLAVTPASAATGVFRLTLTGDQEATPTCAPPDLCGDPDAVGGAILIVNPVRDTVCFLSRWTGMRALIVWERRG